MKLPTRKEFAELNKTNPTKYNNSGVIIVLGCNYHTKWQSHRNMRFVLVEIKGNRARLQTRKTQKDFWTCLEDLIWIDSNPNKNKAKELLGKKKIITQL